MWIVKVVAFEIGEIMEDSDGNLLLRIGTVLNMSVKFNWHNIYFPY